MAEAYSGLQFLLWGIAIGLGIALLGRSKPGGRR